MNKVVNLAALIIVLILASCTSVKKVEKHKTPVMGTLRPLLTKTQETRDVVIILIDREICDENTKIECMNAVQLALGNAAEQGISNSKILIKFLTIDTHTRMQGVIYQLNDIGTLHSVIAYLNEKDLRFLARNLGRKFEIISINNFAKVNIPYVKTISNNFDKILKTVADLVKEQFRILLLDYDNKMMGKVLALLSENIVAKDIVLDYFQFDKSKSSELVKLAREKNIDTIFVNVANQDYIELFKNNWFEGKVFLLNYENNSITNLPNLNDLYFVFWDFDMFGEYSNNYAKKFHEKMPGPKSYALYKYVLRILNVINDAELHGSSNLACYRKSGDKIIKCGQ